MLDDFQSTKSCMLSILGVMVQSEPVCLKRLSAVANISFIPKRVKSGIDIFKCILQSHNSSHSFLHIFRLRFSFAPKPQS